MTTSTELLAEFDELRTRQDIARSQKRKEIVSEIRRLIVDLRIAGRELGFGNSTHPGRRGPRPMYRDPVSGHTWSGRGREPAWIAGKERDPFRIES